MISTINSLIEQSNYEEYSKFSSMKMNKKEIASIFDFKYNISNKRKKIKKEKKEAEKA